MSERDEVRRARAEVVEIEEARLRLASAVRRGDRKAIAEDRQLERRIRDLTRFVMRAEQEEEDEQRAATERRGEELREAWRQHHPQEEED
jgi:hypothetical protein